LRKIPNLPYHARMSVAELDQVPAEALELRESITLAEGALQPDGTIILDLIRPCVGKGRGRHLYTASMLQENAHKLAGWRMYVDHLSDEARRRLQGLPRSVRDLGGRVMESWWDGSVPADPSKGFGQGAVRGRAMPTPFIRELVENDPEIVQCSLNSHATGVKPIMEKGQRVWMVEGIEDKGSVDWVTEAGAGGRVVALMESAYDADEDQEATLLESLTDKEFVDYVRDTRPDLMLALQEQAASDGDDDEAQDEAEFEALVKKFMRNGMPRAAAEKAAKKAQAKADVSESNDDSGGGTPGAAGTEDDSVEITADALREALDTDEGRAALFMVVNEIAPTIVQELVEAQLEDEREVIRVEARADADRQIALRDMRDAAHEMIEAAGLPESFAAKVKAKYALVEGEPSPALDVIDDVDEEGNVTKSASDKLRESVDAEIADARSLIASVSKTRVTGQGPKKQTELRESADGEDDEPAPLPKDGALGALLAGAGFKDPDKVFAPSTAP
jgi:hypothetical protein